MALQQLWLSLSHSDSCMYWRPSASPFWAGWSNTYFRTLYITVYTNTKLRCCVSGRILCCKNYTLSTCWWSDNTLNFTKSMIFLGRLTGLKGDTDGLPSCPLTSFFIAAGKCIICLLLKSRTTLWGPSQQLSWEFLDAYQHQHLICCVSIPWRTSKAQNSQHYMLVYHFRELKHLPPPQIQNYFVTCVMASDGLKRI